MSDLKAGDHRWCYNGSAFENCADNAEFDAERLEEADYLFEFVAVEASNPGQSQMMMVPLLAHIHGSNGVDATECYTADSFTHFGSKLAALKHGRNERWKALHVEQMSANTELKHLLTWIDEIETEGDVIDHEYEVVDDEPQIEQAAESGAEESADERKPETVGPDTGADREPSEPEGDADDSAPSGGDGLGREE